jgi:RNA processing factor Prp31
MEKINGTAHFLKELYERKFYEESRPKNAYEKVIVFQKKIEHFKIEKKTVAKEVQSSSNVLLEEAENHSRHSTNYSSFRLKCSKFANIP